MKLLTAKNLKDLPPLYSTEHKKNPMVWVKFFNPTGIGSWFATAFDGEDTFFGLVDLHEKELGYFSFGELKRFRGRFGLGIERDMYFTPKPLSEVKKSLGMHVDPDEEAPEPKKKAKRSTVGKKRLKVKRPGTSLGGTR